MASLRVIFGTFGTLGEVHPVLAVASELRKRGHEIVILAPASYETNVRSLGFEFGTICSAEWHDAFIGQRLLWHPHFGYALLARGAAEVIEPAFDAVVAHHAPGRTVLVLSWMFVGGRIARDALQVPAVTMHPSPALFRDHAEPPALPPLPFRRNAPRWNGIWFRTIDLLMDHLLGRPVNRLRARLGLPRVHRMMREWIHSPDRVIGLFPDWFAPPQDDWPEQTVLTGFPLYDAGKQTPLSPQLRSFLDEGAPPLAFFTGTGVRHAGAFFDTAIEICRSTGRRGVMLSAFPENFKAVVPPFIHVEAYAPFSLLLPRAAAFFHHGGIGSAAQALVAGTPQIVIPAAFDQADNAERVARLGTGVVIRTGEFNVRKGVAALERVLAEPCARACAEVKERLARAQTSQQTADWIERAFAERRAAA